METTIKAHYEVVKQWWVSQNFTQILIPHCLGLQKLIAQVNNQLST